MAYRYAEDFNDQGATGPDCRRIGTGSWGISRVGLYAGTVGGSK